MSDVDEDVVETLDALRAASARAAFLLRLVNRAQLELVDLRPELEVLVAHLDDATEGFHRLFPPDGDAGLIPDVALIIDNDPKFARSLRRELNSVGVRAYFEADPLQAAKTFGVLRPATVFIDIVLPERNGSLIAAEIKASAPEATVVLVTADLTPETAFGGGLGGADRIVEKGEMGPLLEIARGHLPPARVVYAEGFPTEDEVKRRHARSAVERFGSLAAAARALGIDTRTLERRLSESKQ